MYINKRDLPYFMNNKDWYYFDEEENLYKPTNKAPQKAITSINRFNAEHNYTDENEKHWTDF